MQHRAGFGVINIKTTEKNGQVASMLEVNADDEILVITQNGKLIRVPCSNISSIGRNTQGVRVIQLEEGDKVVAAEKVVEKDEAGVVDEPEATEAPSEPPPDTVH